MWDQYHLKTSTEKCLFLEFGGQLGIDFLLVNFVNTYNCWLVEINLSRYSSLPTSLNIKLFCTLLWQHYLDCNNSHVPLNRFFLIRLANSNSIYFNIVWQHFRQPIRCPHFSTRISEFINTLEYNYKLHTDFQYPFIYTFCITENLVLKFPTVKF